MAESIDEKCIDKEGDPCMYSELCKGKPYGWDGCLMTKTEKTDSVPKFWHQGVTSFISIVDF